MSQQQPDSDPWTNSNQSLWGGGSAVAVAQARADVLARAALIIRARVMLEEAIAASATPVRPFLIEVARSRLANRMANASTVTDANAVAANVNNLLLIDFVLCSKTQPALFRATLLIQPFFSFGFTLLYFTIVYFTRTWYKIKIAMT